MFRVSSEIAARRHVDLRWRAGLVIAARLLGPDRRATLDIGAQIDGLLASEAAVAIAELRCDCVDPKPVVDALVAGSARPTIRKLSLGDYRTRMPALDRLWAKLPGLRELELFGPGVEPGGLVDVASRLTRLRLCCELDPRPLALFEGSPLPRLRALELRLGGDEYFSSTHAEPGTAGDHGLDTARLRSDARFRLSAAGFRLSAAGLGRTGELLARLLDGEVTPGLEHLAIAGVAFADQLIAALADSPLLKRLRSLDLSDSRFAPHRRSLQELDIGGLRLTVRGSDLGPEQLEPARAQFGDRLRTG